MTIFTLKELKKASVVQKLLKRTPKENAIIEINNLLADNQDDLSKIKLEDIEQITKKYKVNLDKKFKEFRLDLFQKYLEHCLADHKLDNEEVESFMHLSKLLFLTDSEIRQVLRAKTQWIFNEEVKKSVADGKLDENEKENLERLKKNLLISNETADSILEKESKAILTKFIDGAISDERLSDKEESRINEIAQNLNIEINHSDKTRAQLDKFKLYWQIENGDIPTLISPINIQKSENLHFQTQVKWLEQRTITKRIDYGGPTARIRLAKGVYYRIGSIQAKRVTEDVWKTIDMGTLYLTNKRLIFMGNKGNKTIRIDKVLDFKPFKDGVDLQKETGKSPFLEFERNVDIFFMMLAKLMNGQ